MLCAKFGWNWPSGSWEEDENVKNFIDRRTDRQTDWRRTTGDQKSSLELSAWWAKKQILFLDHSTSRHQKQKYTLILRTLRVICHKRRENVSRIQISYAQGICIYPLLFIVVVDEVWWGQMGEGLTTSYYLQNTHTINIEGPKHFCLFCFKLPIWIRNNNITIILGLQLWQNGSHWKHSSKKYTIDRSFTLYCQGQIRCPYSIKNDIVKYKI